MADDVHERLSRQLLLPPGSPVPAALRLLIVTGLGMVGADEGSFLVNDTDAGDLVFAMTVGHAASESMLLGQRVPITASITGLAATRREVQIGTPTYTAVTQPGRNPESVLAAPVIAHNVVLGVMTAVSFSEGRRFDSAAARSFGGLAVIAGLLIDQAQQLERVADPSLR
jgi:hypothetical protein